MNETKKLLSILGIAGIAIVILIIATVTSSIKGSKYVDKVNEAFESEEAVIVYLGRPTCSYCTLIKPTLDEFAKEYKFDYEYINTDKIGTSNLNKILDKLEIPSNEFGTPYIAIVKDGKIVDTQNGYVAENKLFEFFQKNGFIGESETLALNYINYTQFEEMYNNGEKEIVTLIQTGCSYCEKAKPVLANIAKQYNIKINILNITDMTDDENTKLAKMLPVLNSDSWGTPLTLIIENKAQKDKLEGYKDKEEFVQFFKDNGFIGE